MKLVICEGNDDVAVIGGIRNHFQIQGLKIESCEGRNNLERYLQELPKRADFARGEVRSLAVIIDAETNVGSSWDKLKNAVKLGFGVVLNEQQAFAGDNLKIAGLVISGGQNKGMIEDLCLEAVSDQPGYQCLQDYFACLAERTEQKEYHSKAKFNAWMASQSELSLRVGSAAEKGYLPWDKAAFEPLRRFLQSL